MCDSFCESEIVYAPSHSFWSWGNVLVLLLYASLLWETSLGRPRSISCLAGSVCPRLLPSNCWPVGYIARLHCLTFDPHKHSPPLTIWCKPQPRSKSIALLHQVWLPCISSCSYAFIGNFYLPSFVVVCVGISMTSTMLGLFSSATEILIWDYASMGLLEGPHFRENLSKCTFSFACLSWNLRRTVLFVACLCPSSESVETAPGTTWLKSTYLGQWHCWRHHTLIYHIDALKVIFHICYFWNAAACWLIMF